METERQRESAHEQVTDMRARTRQIWKGSIEKKTKTQIWTPRINSTTIKKLFYANCFSSFFGCIFFCCLPILWYSDKFHAFICVSERANVPALQYTAGLTCIYWHWSLTAQQQRIKCVYFLAEVTEQQQTQKTTTTTKMILKRRYRLSCAMSF